jgi:arylsulfatase A-like enzyme
MPPPALTRRELLELLAVSSLALPFCAAPRRGGPSVVVVLVDELRKDASDLWLTGVNRLADGGVVFDGMRSVAPWTYPSVITLLSGLYPQQHGADGHLFGNILSHFDSAVPMLPAQLREVGYRTAAFVTNPFLLEWNAFHEGFGHFDGSFINSQGNRRGQDRLVWVPDTMFAETVNPAIRRHFDAQPLEGPEFTYVHYIDVHGPWHGAPFEPSYSASVRFIDEKILELHDYFTRRYAGDLIFVVTSDHGKALADDVEVGGGPRFRKNKATVHDFNLKIPFAILPGAPVRAIAPVSAPCSNVDFAPTLLEWLGLSPPHELPGVSLMPALRGEPLPGAERPLYAKMSAFGRLNDCVVWRGRKYVRHFDPRSRLPVATRIFDLERDPREIDPLEEALGPAEAVLAEVAGEHGRSWQARFEDVPERLQQQLRALGYLQ